MHKAIVAMVVILAAPAAWAQQPKSHPVDVDPGRAAWFDITTSDLAQSKVFYSKLFGWEFRPVKGTDLAGARSGLLLLLPGSPRSTEVR